MSFLGVRSAAGRAAWTLAGLTFACAPSFAQEPLKYESAVLYSYLQSDAPSGESSFDSYKWTLTVYRNRHWGLGGDIVNAEAGNSDLLFGPELRVLGSRRVGLRLHARAGAVDRLTRDAVTRATRNTWSFATATGASVDVFLGYGVSWRVAQPEVVWWWRRGEARTDFRASTGVVLQWGKPR